MKKFERLLAMGGDQSLRDYDAFINHRGRDVKMTLASVLYHFLCNTNLSVFLDNRAIQHGHDIRLAIRHAIRTSPVHIAIFSRHYAESTWCLKELCWMIESGAPIIPVFWGVRPCDLRKQGGMYSKFLQKHVRSGRVDAQTVNKWRTALIQVSYNYGFRFQGHRDYGVLLENISGCVMKQIKARRQFQF